MSDFFACDSAGHMIGRLASMKQKFNFATWWRYISGRKYYCYTLATKMALPGCEIYFLFHTNNAKLPSLSDAQNYLDIFNILGLVRYKSFVLT